MTNMSLISKATELVIDIYEADSITIPTENIMAEVADWYNHTDITDAELLATAAITYGNFNKSANYKEICDVRDLYFGTIDEYIEKCGIPTPIEETEEYYASILPLYDDNISVEELKYAAEDAMYW